MIKKLLLVSGILFSSYYFLRGGIIENQTMVQIAQADETLITPQEIEFFDTNGDPLNYVEWFTEALEGSGVNPANIGAWFGTYQFSPKDDTVYLAVGIDRPAAQGGAAIGTASVRNDDPTQMTLEFTPVINRVENSEAINYLEEDGAHEMDFMPDGNLLIAGTDPAMGDGTGGNAYILNTTTNELTKIRCSTGLQTLDCVTDHGTAFVFPSVIHFFGITRINDTMYIAGSAYPSINGVSDPVVYQSEDSGATWEETWLYPSSFYRIKDIIGFEDTYSGNSRQLLYTDLANSFGILANNGAFLSISTLIQPVAFDWEQQYSGGGRAPHTFVKGTVFNGTPIYAHYNGTSLFRFRQELDGTYEIDDIPLVGISIGQTYASDNYYKHHAMLEIDDYLYVVADDNDIYKSNLEEPVTWTKVSEIDDAHHIITMNYWEEKNALLVASHGTDARNFYIPLPSPQPSPSPTLTTAKVNGVTCDWEIPNEKPNLFRVARNKTEVELQFTPVKGVTGYYISYGLDETLNQFGTHFQWSDDSGVIKYKIYDLDPKKTYSFSVRSQNHCQPGQWSNTVKAKP